MRLIPIVLALTLPGVASAVDCDLVDDFDADEQAWRSGGGNDTPPTWVADGGPDGAGDGYLRIEASGGGGAGSKLVAFNTEQWSGDYAATGITHISMMANNLGPNPLTVRLAFRADGAMRSFDASVALPPGSGWRPVTFELAAGLAQPLGRVTELRILHAAAPSFRGTAIEGVLGVDRIAVSGCAVEADGGVPDAGMPPDAAAVPPDAAPPRLDAAPPADAGGRRRRRRRRGRRARHRGRGGHQGASG
ncbi:MAG: hypothetical protein H6704_04135 [Myxococcales bacterium]|nr:hypothetical protein [Myxococcales bacterium]